MALYEIVIGTCSDDTNYSKLVLSNEHLTESNVDDIVGLDRSYGEYIVRVNIAEVLTNAHDEEEYEELNQIKLTINQ